VPLDQSFIGRTYPVTRRYEVGLEKVREFAAAIGDPNPVHRDVEAARAAGHPAVIAPLTFAIIINLRAIHEIVADPELGLDWSRVVHGEQSFEYHRPIQVGDSLGIATTIENIMTRAGNDFLVMRAEVTAEPDTPVLTITATVIVRGDQ
jgi:acyl dehydratase